jgi:hypothetical protein
MFAVMNRPFRTTAIAVFALVGMQTLSSVGCGPSQRDLSNAIVLRVEEFKRANGRLPNSLQEVGVEEYENCPSYCKTKDNGYLVWYGARFGQSDAYDSRTKKWSDVNGTCDGA